MNLWLKLIACTTATLLFADLVFAGRLVGQESNSTDSAKKKSVDYARDVQPIFDAHCYSCHGPAKQESNFRLDVRNRAFANGDIGDPPIVPGDSKQSPLIGYVSAVDSDLVMPPEGDGNRLSEQQVQTLRRWIDEGANWPDEMAGEVGRKKITTDHWSFQPIVDPPLPAVGLETTEFLPLRNGIDHFIGRQLELNGIRPSKPADKVSLIRRVYLNMHGLQPTPGQVRAFVNDDSENAYSNLIGQVLESHHYGERWARHWLDVVRFGESTGYEVNRDRANAYYYRDYVIESLNKDKSYRDFIVEQLAGDAVGVDEATGFLVGGAYDVVKSPDVNLTLMQREDELADFVNTTSTAFLGLTVGCARCHNHKFDPILQSDYYSLQAVFAGVEHGERKLLNQIPKDVRESWEKTQSNLKIQERKLDDMRAAFPSGQVSGDLLPKVNAKRNTDSFEAVGARFLRFTIHQTNQSEPCIDELEVYSAVQSVNEIANGALASQGCTTKSSGDYPNNPKHKLEHINDGKLGNDFSWISNTQGSGWVQIEFPEVTEINRVVWGRDRNGAYADRLAIGYSISVSTDENQWQEVSSSTRRKPFLVNGKEPENAFIARLTGDEVAKAKKLLDAIKQLRAKSAKLDQLIPLGYVGKFKKPAATRRLYRGDPMSPREEVAPDILTVMGTLGMQKDEAEQARRLALARWIASDSNPLTARVMVNRVWHYHFGRGIVSTPSDFGKNGATPTHPELLDWLTSRFIENKWSLKWLHRKILSSSTYQQSSRPRSDASAKDADGKWLWRFPLRRLEAEAIRDCVLQLTGKLNPKAGGPGFLLFKIDRENVHHYFPLEDYESEHFRRMIYMTKIRQEQDDVFGVFDCPDGGQSIPNRNRSTTALQALNMLNSKFIVEQAKFLSERLIAEAGEKTEPQIRLAFDLAFSRLPNEAEMDDALNLIDRHGLKAFCRALLNTNEFLFVR